MALVFSKVTLISEEETRSFLVSANRRARVICEAGPLTIGGLLLMRYINSKGKDK